MARAAALSKASAVNRKKAGAPSSKRAGVNLPNLPSFNGPPPGTFDPGLEAQVRAAERGLIDLIEKTHREGGRESVDTQQARRLLERKVQQGHADIQRSRGYAVTDAGQAQGQLQTSFARDLQDLAIAKQNGEEDYQRKLLELQHSYADQAARQGQASVAQGTHETGTTAASDAVRGANERWDRSGVDTAHQRQLDAIALAEGRDTEDFTRQSGLISQDLGRQLTGFGIQDRRLGQEARTQQNKLSLARFRATQDRQTALSHAKREYGIYSTDVAQQAYYQAHQLNPNIIFPVPSAAAGLAPGAHPAGPAIGRGLPAVHYPATHNPPIDHHVGLSPAVSFRRRPYTRYSSSRR